MTEKESESAGCEHGYRAAGGSFDCPACGAERPVTLSGDAAQRAEEIVSRRLGTFGGLLMAEQAQEGTRAVEERETDNPRICHIIEENGRPLCGMEPKSGRGVHSLERCSIENHPFCVVCTAMDAAWVQGGRQ